MRRVTVFASYAGQLNACRQQRFFQANTRVGASTCKNSVNYHQSARHLLPAQRSGTARRNRRCLPCVVIFTDTYRHESED